MRQVRWSVPTGPLTDVSCPSVSLCVAVDYVGNVLTTRNPTRSASAWAVTNIDPSANAGGSGLDGLSCPSVSFCIAVDSYAGYVLRSRNPTGGRSAWNITQLGVGLSRVSCASVSFCVAIDSLNPGGDVVSGNPAGDPSAWAAGAIDASNVLTDVTCPSRSLCVAVDSAGNVVVGVSPAPTARQVKALLLKELAPSGRAAKIRAILHRGGYSFSIRARGAGRAVISWYYVVKGAHIARGKPKPVLVATAKKTFTAAGTAKITLKLTKTGKQLLKQRPAPQAHSQGHLHPDRQARHRRYQDLHTEAITALAIPL